MMTIHALSPQDARMLYLHGGGYVLGSAPALTGFAGQIAARAGADAFVPDYRLAPEHPFPAAIDDVVAAYRGLIAKGAERIVVVGDSAGGGRGDYVVGLGGHAACLPILPRPLCRRRAVRERHR